jgi:apolipoprotein N-acyltransferase
MRRALALGWAFGFGQFVLGLNWIATAFTFQAAMPASLGWVAVVLLSAYLAVYPAMAAGLAWRYGRRSQLQMGLLLAAAWMVTEWLRGTMFTGFAWNPVGVSLLTTPLAQLSPFVGTYGLSAIAVLGGAVFALAFTREHVTKRQGAWLALVLAAATGAGWLRDGRDARGHADGARRAAQYRAAEQARPGVRRGNLPAADRADGRPRDEPRLVFWPEAAIPDFLEDEPAPSPPAGQAARARATCC